MICALGLLAGAAFALTYEAPGEVKKESEERAFATNDPVERGCSLSKEIILRTWRGYYSGRSEDVVMVPQFPNYSGTFDLVNHSGPWDYLTNVPLMLYGPEHIQPRGRVEGPASITDVYPTAGALSNVDLPPRDGRILSEAIKPGAENPPKLIVTVVWDGVGRNVLEEWPEAWPTLARLEREGTSFVNASVGSSPTITPATHSSLGTGAFPRSHGVTGIYYQEPNQKVTGAFKNRATEDLELSTFGDEIDRAYGNASLVGLLASRSWHMGMLGHGSRMEGGDEDQLGIFREELVADPSDDFSGATSGYSFPESLTEISWSRLEEHAVEVDRSDGQIDGEWLGHTILTEEQRDNPAWVMHETDAIIQMMQGEGYGADEVPDFLFTNLKMADTVGHHYLMDSGEMGLILEALDDSLRRIVGYLDREVGEYVLVLTADHGHTPPASRTGAWPVRNGVLAEDVDAHFDAPRGENLVERNVAVGLFLNQPLMRELDLTSDDVARYVNEYTIRENWPEGELPPGYVHRGDENVFSAAWTDATMDDVMRCAFGSERPPKRFDGSG
ncbi:MAG: alkaline phosphatase family protein [Actinomycetota bacterium]